MTELLPQEPFIDIDRALAILDRIPLFGGLSDAQLCQIFFRLKKVNYRANEMIFHQGDPSSYIYIVLSGVVRMVFDVENHPLVKQELCPGDCFGETSVIGIQCHSASSVVDQDAELMVLAKEDLMDIFNADKELFSQLILNIARETCRRLHETDELLLQYIHQQPCSFVQLPLPGMSMAAGPLIARHG